VRQKKPKNHESIRGAIAYSPPRILRPRMPAEPAPLAPVRLWKPDLSPPRHETSIGGLPKPAVLCCKRQPRHLPADNRAPRTSISSITKNRAFAKLSRHAVADSVARGQRLTTMTQGKKGYPKKTCKHIAPFVLAVRAARPFFRCCRRDAGLADELCFREVDVYRGDQSRAGDDLFWTGAEFQAAELGAWHELRHRHRKQRCCPR